MSNVSTELSNRIKLLKGDRTTADIVKGANVSRETFRKIERGDTVKLSTLMDIADFLDADDQQRTGLVIAWVKIEIGPHAKQVQLSTSNAALHDGSDEAKEIQSIVAELSAFDRKQVMLVMTRPEVRRVLPALNALYDHLRKIRP